MKEFVKLLNGFAPETATDPEFKDNVGLMLPSKRDIKKVMCCLDCTPSVVEQASVEGADVIVSHHPAIFNPLRTLCGKDALLRAAECGIAVYSMHTNLDYCDGGINDYVISLFDVEGVQPLKSVDGIKIGRAATLKKPCSLEKAVMLCEKIFNEKHVPFTGDKNKIIKKIAILCGGGGGDTEFVDSAREVGADALITSDLKHHVALYAKEVGVCLISPTHYATEHIYISRLAEIIKQITSTETCVAIETPPVETL